MFHFRESKKKYTKLESALKELAAAKASNALLNKEWGKAQEHVGSLLIIFNATRSESSDMNSEFNGGVGPSNTRHIV